MKTLIHQSPQGDLEIVGVPGVIERGEPFEVADELAEGLLIQTDLYHVASKSEIKRYADAKAAEAKAAADAKNSEESSS